MSGIPIRRIWREGEYVFRSSEVVDYPPTTKIRDIEQVGVLETRKTTTKTYEPINQVVNLTSLQRVG